MNLEAETHYELLGVSEAATPEELKSAYRAFMRAHHPDLHPGEDHAELSRRGSSAYSILKDPEKRAAYDASLHTPPGEEVPEEEWAPSWGQEETWGEEVFEEVVEDSWDQPADSRPASSFSDAPSFDEATPISKLPPEKLPEELREGKVHFKSGLPTSLLALALMALVPLGASFLHRLDANYSSYSLPLAGASAVAGLVLAARGKPSRSMGWPAILMVTAAVFLGAHFALTAWGSEFQHPIFLLVVPALTSFLLFSSLVAHWKTSKFLKPRALRKNNNFGSLSGRGEDEALEEALNPLWALPGLRCFHVAHGAFSHILIFHKKVVLLKPVFLPQRSVLKFSGPTLMGRTGSGYFTPLLEDDYITSLAQFTSLLPKSVKVYPMVVAFPGAHLVSFEQDSRTTLVAGDDVAALVAKVLVAGESSNVVDHSVAVQALKAAYGVPA